MRTVIAAAALACAAGAGQGEAAPQDERPWVFQRVCNVVPGRAAEAEALARELVDLVGRKHPAAEMSAQTGRWMTGFQNIERPVDQILFSEQHPDPDLRRVFNEILLADDEFRALQRKTAAVIDFGSCTETRFRARP